jgi:restriction system protein
MSAQLGTDIAQRALRRESQRFAKVGRGIFALARQAESSLRHDVETHNEKVRNRLLTKLKEMDPDTFEAVITVLLERMGFEDVEKTSRSNDGEIDVFGNLVVADVIKTRMAVQVKRWADNVPRPIVQQVRGSLGVHDQGLIITTGGFSKGAMEEADKPNAVLVALMSGEQVVNLLIQFGIGVDKTPITILAHSSDPISPPTD